MQRVWLVLVVVGLAPASSVLAQVPASPQDGPAAQVSTTPKAPDDGATLGSLLSDLGRELAGLPSKSTAVTLALGGVAALAVHPTDATLTERATHSLPLDELLDLGAVAGDGWMQGSAALATFTMGRALGS